MSKTLEEKRYKDALMAAGAGAIVGAAFRGWKSGLKAIWDAPLAQGGEVLRDAAIGAVSAAAAQAVYAYATTPKAERKQETLIGAIAGLPATGQRCGLSHYMQSMDNLAGSK